MRSHLACRVTIATASTVLILAIGAAGASARFFTYSSQDVSMRWSALSFNASTGTVSCPVTLTGSLHRRVNEKGLVLAGVSKSATLNNAACTGGSATILGSSLPWHYRLHGFVGTLPQITRILGGLIGVAVQVNIGGTACLATSDTTEPVLLDLNIGASGEARTADLDSSAEIDLEDDRFLCALAGDASFSGRANVTNNLGGTITVGLI